MVDRLTFHLDFVHAGAKCPACGYVYTRGFSAVELPGVNEPHACPIVPCTRCLRILELSPQGVLRELNAVELMLLSDIQRHHMAILSKMLAPYRESLS